jgi:hypothetical protein
MYNANSRHQPHMLAQVETQRASIAVSRPRPRRAFSLRSLLSALAFIGEARVMPFSPPTSAYGERPSHRQ